MSSLMPGCTWIAVGEGSIAVAFVHQMLNQ
jgi:hypothetical protein